MKKEQRVEVARKCHSRRDNDGDASWEIIEAELIEYASKKMRHARAREAKE